MSSLNAASCPPLAIFGAEMSRSTARLDLDFVFRLFPKVLDRAASSPLAQAALDRNAQWSIVQGFFPAYGRRQSA
jgi:hypothetical protein